MPGEPPLDGSADPVGLEPDIYEVDDEAFDPENISRVTAEVDLPLPGHRFDPTADAFDADRQDSYEDWISTEKTGKRRNYRACAACGIAQPEQNFPPPGGRDSGSTCVNCLNGVPPEQVVKRDPANTLRSIKQTGYKPTLAIPIDDRPTSVWEVLDSPLRFEGLVLLTAGKLGLVLTRTPTRKRTDHRVIDSWKAATVRPSSRAKQFLGDLGFVRPVLTGAIDDVDLVGEFDPAAVWSYVVLARG